MAFIITGGGPLIPPVIGYSHFYLTSSFKEQGFEQQKLVDVSHPLEASPLGIEFNIAVHSSRQSSSDSATLAFALQGCKLVFAMFETGFSPHPKVFLKELFLYVCVPVTLCVCVRTTLKCLSH